jgi:hypothetical protein
MFLVKKTQFTCWYIKTTFISREEYVTNVTEQSCLKTDSRLVIPEDSYQISEEPPASALSSEDGGSTFFRNVGISVQIHSAFKLKDQLRHRLVIYVTLEIKYFNQFRSLLPASVLSL